MEEYADLTDESDEIRHFTFPQVKPLYSSLRKVNRPGPTRKAWKPLRLLAPQEAQITDLSEDDSVSIGSFKSIGKSRTEDEKHLATQNKSINSDSSTNSTSSTVQTPFSAKGSITLVKRIPKNSFTPGNRIIEEHDVKLMKNFKSSQASCDIMSKEMSAKNDGKQDVPVNSNSDGSHWNARVLKDVSNYDHNNQSKKFVEPVKSVKGAKLTNGSRNGALEVPTIEGEEANKLSKMSVPQDTKKNVNSCVTKHQNDIESSKENHQIKEVIHNPRNFNSSSSETHVLTVNGVQYSILSKLGQGGSSQVYQVLDRRTSSLYAVKCVNLDADETTAMGYLKEIEVLLKLQKSKRVIKLIDHEYLKSLQKLYVVMEKGDTDLSTLLKLMAKSGDVSMPMIIYYWTEILLAVQEIHSHGIVHADLKPANFLLVCGRLKLIDFGIASSLQNDATSVLKSSMHGTCNYMSPEAIQDPGDSSRTKVGYKSDVWSLGCILYNLLYQKTPFQDISNNMMKLYTIINRSHKINFPPVENCPPPLMDALKRCLNYEAKKRPTVAELLAVNYIWPTNMQNN